MERPNPEALLVKDTDHQEILSAIAELPVEFREAIFCASWRICPTKKLLT